MANAHRARLILSVVATDATFVKAPVRGKEAWVGRCIHCRSKLVVPLDGAASAEVTVEHVVPRTHGGGDEPANLALACARCNAEKGIRHDVKHKNDRARLALETALVARRAERWRGPAAGAPGGAIDRAKKPG